MPRLRKLKPSEHRLVRIEEARQVARAMAFTEVYRARRAAGGALVRYQIAPRGNEEQAVEYAALMSETTGFSYDPRLYITEVFGERDPAKGLRAQLFAYTMRDHLRTRYGTRWCAYKGARDELIDMWNTGTRYTLEELTQLTTGGTPDAGMLAATHIELLQGGQE